MSCGADTEANALLNSLTAGLSFDIPEVDLDSDLFKLPGNSSSAIFKDVTRLTNADLVGETGTFDALMKGFGSKLQEQFEKGRITGKEFADAYVQLTTAAMANATQYLLGRDQAFWQAAQAQAAAITARVQLEAAKVQLAQVQLEAQTQKVNYARAKMDLTNSDIQYCISKFQLEYLLPLQRELQQSQLAGQTIENSTRQFTLSTMLPLQRDAMQADLQLKTIQRQSAQYELEYTLPAQTQKIQGDIAYQQLQSDTVRFNLANLLPKQVTQLEKQTESIQYDNETKIYTLSQILPQQSGLLTAQRTGAETQTAINQYQLSTMLPAQHQLLLQQHEVQRAQTQDTGINGGPLTGGLIGRQKALYEQQVKSYKSDSELKAAKLFTDAWTVMKTIDEGLQPPNGFSNTSVNEVLNTLKTNLNIGVPQ